MNAIPPAPNQTSTAAAPDFEAIKAKQNAAWSSGDYARVGTTLQIVGETLAETLALAPDSQVLDVAAGNGNATLAFARRWCCVTSTDYVGSLLEAGRARAQAEALPVDFRVADAENLPFGDDRYDAVVSTFGVMFTPNQTQAAGELIRVCRSGGRIGMANWTPDSFIGQLFKTLGGHIAPPPGVQSPARWGSQPWIEETFGPAAETIDITLRDFVFRYRTPEHFVDFFRTYYGPVEKAFLALDETGRAALEADMYDLIARYNQASDGSMRVPGAYAEVAITLK